MTTRTDIELATPCILWAGAIDAQGYGTLGRRYAHRLAYVDRYGEIPARHQVDHVCHTVDTQCMGGPTCPHRRCINPLHLEAVTHQENIARGRGITNVHAAKTHCAQGHEFTPENTYIRKDRPTGGRVCIECRRINLRAFYRRRAGAES